MMRHNILIDGKVRLIRLKTATNFRLHDEQTVIRSRKIAWASIYLYIYISIYIYILLPFQYTYIEKGSNG